MYIMLHVAKIVATYTYQDGKDMAEHPSGINLHGLNFLKSLNL